MIWYTRTQLRKSAPQTRGSTYFAAHYASESLVRPADAGVHRRRCATWLHPTGPPHPLTEERTFQHRFELTKPEPKKKPKMVRKPKPRKEKPRKDPKPKRTPEEQREARRLYEQARNQTAERKEAARLHGKKARQQRKENGQCRNCSNAAIPGQTRCESCRDKHNRSR